MTEDKNSPPGISQSNFTDAEAQVAGTPDVNQTDFEQLETYLDPVTTSPSGLNRSPQTQAHYHKAGPLVMVETAFLASTAALIWLVNTYFPPGPILRILFPLPVALVYLRWGARAAWMTALVTGLLLAVLMGPPAASCF
ncbi:MAG: hypothetical protein LVS60_11490 [Nodosilinea sp. LVE1205-7]|jgi:hypothetical protein